ncbi:MAG: sigma-54-dependent Fis family transcriptional regulator [SAR324 cluster bacterium]|nr:sigma-54-dependent Fis family transcriptional regulator [SAR324 cluster bacterium]MBL7035499.1 sigma-54-dependent Fis family transcriptional regulator [SAR324 cluster bacterium]
MVTQPVLIVDDEVEMRIAMSETLKHCGYPVEISHNAIDALKKFKQNEYSLVITDMTMPKRSGLELLKDIKNISPGKPVIMATAYGTVETAVEAMKYGAFDYIRKPINFDSFQFIVQQALNYKGTSENAASTAESRPSKSKPVSLSKEIITQNKAMLSLLEVARNVAKSKSTMMIQSESGTGKELLAYFIHENSDRAKRPFVAINCAALPETLLESELFGHAKGAFTGAINDYRGKFEQAHTGTILLDEISEMALPLQAKLLRVLQEFQIDKVGGKEPIPVDVRVIATTNQNLMGMVDAGKFREDLYFRLNVIPLALPPLRDRMDDVPVLVTYFIKKHSLLNKRDCPAVSRETLNILTNYHWRGNVRELENVMERALLLCNGEEIQPNHLLMSSQMGELSLNDDLASISPSISKASQSATVDHDEVSTEADSTDTADLGIEVGMSMKEAEKRFIFKTLNETKGNRTHAAKTLGISIRTLRNKLNEYRAEGEDLELEPED